MLDNPSWEIVKGGSRKKKDLLRDGLGNEFTRRSAGVWQCTKMDRNNSTSKSTRNRCQAIARAVAKDGRFNTEKSHSHPTQNSAQ